MSRSGYYVGKREPKSKAENLGCYGFCGLTCCSPIGAAPGRGMRKWFRSQRRRAKAEAIQAGLQDFNEE